MRRERRARRARRALTVAAGRTSLTPRISPVVFLSLWNLWRKYQKRDLAVTSLGAKIRMR